MIRPLRGRVVIREDKRLSSIIEVVGVDPRSITTHRGTVIAVGPPVFLDDQVETSPEVPLDFKVGDIVGYHFEATEKGRICDWGDHRDVLVMSQREIDYVLSS